VLTDKTSELDRAMILLNIEKQALQRNKFKKWVLLVFGIMVGFLTSKATILIANTLGLSLYSRDGLDSQLKKYFD